MNNYHIKTKYNMKQSHLWLNNSETVILIRTPAELEKHRIKTSTSHEVKTLKMKFYSIAHSI